MKRKTHQGKKTLARGNVEVANAEVSPQGKKQGGAEGGLREGEEEGEAEDDAHAHFRTLAPL